jgi:hypothetical protein
MAFPPQHHAFDHPALSHRCIVLTRNGRGQVNIEMLRDFD